MFDWIACLVNNHNKKQKKQPKIIGTQIDENTRAPTFPHFIIVNQTIKNICFSPPFSFKIFLTHFSHQRTHTIRNKDDKAITRENNYISQTSSPKDFQTSKVKTEPGKVCLLSWDLSCPCPRAQTHVITHPREKS